MIVPRRPPFRLYADPLRTLREAPFIRFDRDTWTGLLVKDVLNRCDVRVHDAMELNSVEAILAIVRQGFGVSIVPRARQRRLDARSRTSRDRAARHRHPAPRRPARALAAFADALHRCDQALLPARAARPAARRLTLAASAAPPPCVGRLYTGTPGSRSATAARASIKESMRSCAVADSAASALLYCACFDCAHDRSPTMDDILSLRRSLACRGHRRGARRCGHAAGAVVYSSVFDPPNFTAPRRST